MFNKMNGNKYLTLVSTNEKQRKKKKTTENHGVKSKI